VVVRIDDDELKNHLLWQELPPIFYSCYQIQALPGTDVLVEANPAEMNIRLPNQTLPLIMTRKLTDNKAMAIMGYGIWRWNLLMWGIGKSDQLFTQFLNNSFRWLTNKEDSKNVRISPDQEIYRSGQKINFSCQVYNENYVPIDGAEVKISIFNQNKNYEISLSATGDGKYEGGLQALEGGDYKYTGTASYKNLVLGSDDGQFSVENFNLEHLQTKIDEDFLRQLASKTDGLFITDSTLNSLEKALKFPARIKTESREWQLWNKLILLVLVIVLLSIEWFIRKSSGML
jgi:hypothetical protein